MTEKPLISIITPTYNHEKFINQCIESVLAQDYTNWEQIIIDDGSTDSTEKVISGYKDERIRYIKQKNRGIWNLNESYNKALKNSKGKLIAILEGDDFWPSSKLSKQLKAFEDPNVVLSWGNAYTTNKKGSVIEISRRNVFKSNESIPGNIILKKLFLTNFITACTVICKKDALIRIGGFKQPEKSPCVDYSTWLQLAEEGKFYYLDEMLGYWRRHEKQTSSNKTLEMIKANRSYSAYLFSNLSKNKKDVIGIKIEDIYKNNKQTVSSTYFHLGRVGLYEKDWEIGKKNFEYAFINGDIPLKLKSMIGIILSHLKLNFEWIAKILNIPQLKDLY